MRFARTLGAAAMTGALIVGLVLDVHRPVHGATDVKSSQATINRPAADIADTYTSSPARNNPNNLVVAMNVYPNAPTGTFFDQGVLYQMKFDTKYGSEAVGAGPVPNQVIQFSVTAPGNGTQGVYVYGPAAPNETTTANTTVAQTAFGQFGTSFSASNGITVFAGLRAATRRSSITRSSRRSSRIAMREARHRAAYPAARARVRADSPILEPTRSRAPMSSRSSLRYPRRC